MSDKTLTVEEVAGCLDLPATTIERWIRQGRIPIQKRRGKCVFNVSALKKWAGRHNLTFTMEGDSRDDAPALEMDNLLSALKRGGVYYGVEGRDVSEVLGAAVCCLDGIAQKDRAELLERLLEREELTSTGIGKGVAVPHPRQPVDSAGDLPVIATCFLENEVMYGAVDDQPVFILFILLCPTVPLHLHMLSRLAFCLRDDSFVTFLKGSPPAEEIYEKVVEFEKKLDGAENR